MSFCYALSNNPYDAQEKRELYGSWIGDARGAALQHRDFRTWVAISHQKDASSIQYSAAKIIIKSRLFLKEGRSLRFLKGIHHMNSDESHRSLSTHKQYH